MPGFRHSVDWWGLPTRLEWAQAPDRGAGVTKLGLGLVAHGLRASAWPQGAGTKVLGWRGVATSLEAGGRSPGRVPGVTPWGLLPNVVVSEHAYSCGTRRRPFVRACLVLLLGKQQPEAWGR